MIKSNSLLKGAGRNGLAQTCTYLVPSLNTLIAPPQISQSFTPVNVAPDRLSPHSCAKSLSLRGILVIVQTDKNSVH